MTPYIFTLGHGQIHGPRGYVEVYARSYNRARELMFQCYDRNWSFQYNNHVLAGVQEYNLHLINTLFDDCPRCHLGMGFDCPRCIPISASTAYLLGYYQASRVPGLASDQETDIALIQEADAWDLPVTY